MNNQKLTYVSLALNAVLLIAVVILYIFHFKGNTTMVVTEGTDSTGTEMAVAPAPLPEIRSVNGAIAYVDLTQLNKRYLFIKERSEALMKDRENKQKMLLEKEEQLAKAFQKYEQEYPTLAETEKMDREEKLAKDRDALLEYKQKLEMELADKDVAFQSEILKRIDDYLRGLSKEKNYSYVFTYEKGGPATIVFANDSLDITERVLTGLNAAYKKKK